MRKTTLAPGNFCVQLTWRKVTLARRVTRLPTSRSHPGATKNVCEQLQAPDHAYAPRQS